MSQYDQLAFSNKPTFYLASPNTADQSAGSVSVSANTMVLAGQPIIYGHPSSFKVAQGSTIDLNGNIAFIDGTTTEFVLFAQKPIVETPVIVSDNGSGIFITPTSVAFRLSVVSNSEPRQLTGEVRISDWSEKLYVQLVVAANQVVLVVNGKSKALTLDGALDSAITQTSIGKTFSTGYYFLIDGIGFYKSRVESKQNVLNDFGQGHLVYSSYLLKGQTTLFDTFDSGGSKVLTFADFRFDAPTGLYLYSFHVSKANQSTLYLNVNTNDDQSPIVYDMNSGAVLTFTKSTTINVSNLASVITFGLPTEIDDSFIMTIDTILSADILAHTPAFLTASGTPVFPPIPSESIVNCPQGVDMDMASYSGKWLYPDQQTAPPQSIELVFKPKDSTQTIQIFKSGDGSITNNVQTGYSMWLNGVSASNLNNLLWNQWNHLVLTKTTTIDNTFFLNTDGTGSIPQSIDYLFISSYPDVLSSQSIQTLYAITAGINILSVSEEPFIINEGTFDNGQPFQAFGLTWSIVGAGGG